MSQPSQGSSSSAERTSGEETLTPLPPPSGGGSSTSIPAASASPLPPPPAQAATTTISSAKAASSPSAGIPTTSTPTSTSTTATSTTTTTTTEKKKQFTAKNLTQELVSRVAAGTKATGYAGNRLTLLKGATTSPAFGGKPTGKPLSASAAPSAPLQKVKAEVSSLSLVSPVTGGWGNKVADDEGAKGAQEKAEQRRTSALSAKAPWAKDSPTTGSVSTPTSGSSGVGDDSRGAAEDKAVRPVGWRQATALGGRGGGSGPGVGGRWQPGGAEEAGEEDDAFRPSARFAAPEPPPPPAVLKEVDFPRLNQPTDQPQPPHYSSSSSRPSYEGGSGRDYGPRYGDRFQRGGYGEPPRGGNDDRYGWGGGGGSFDRGGGYGRAGGGGYGGGYGASSYDRDRGRDAYHHHDRTPSGSWGWSGDTAPQHGGYSGPSPRDNRPSFESRAGYGVSGPPPSSVAPPAPPPPPPPPAPAPSSRGDGGWQQPPSSHQHSYSGDSGRASYEPYQHRRAPSHGEEDGGYGSAHHSRGPSGSGGGGGGGYGRSSTAGVGEWGQSSSSSGTGWGSGTTTSEIVSPDVRPQVSATRYDERGADDGWGQSTQSTVTGSFLYGGRTSEPPGRAGAPPSSEYDTNAKDPVGYNQASPHQQVPEPEVRGTTPQTIVGVRPGGRPSSASGVGGEGTSGEKDIGASFETMSDYMKWKAQLKKRQLEEQQQREMAARQPSPSSSTGSSTGPSPTSAGPSSSTDAPPPTPPYTAEGSRPAEPNGHHPTALLLRPGASAGPGVVASSSASTGSWRRAQPLSSPPLPPSARVPPFSTEAPPLKEPVTSAEEASSSHPSSFKIISKGGGVEQPATEEVQSGQRQSLYDPARPYASLFPGAGGPQQPPPPQSLVVQQPQEGEHPHAMEYRVMTARPEEAGMFDPGRGPLSSHVKKLYDPRQDKMVTVEAGSGQTKKRDHQPYQQQRKKQPSEEMMAYHPIVSPRQANGKEEPQQHINQSEDGARDAVFAGRSMAAGGGYSQKDSQKEKDREKAARKREQLAQKLRKAREAREEQERVEREATLERERQEAAERREARAKEKAERGPRTKGVLYRYNEQGEPVNADVSEEEMAARAEAREKRRVQREAAAAAAAAGGRGADHDGTGGAGGFKVKLGQKGLMTRDKKILVPRQGLAPRPLNRAAEADVVQATPAPRPPVMVAPPATNAWEKPLLASTLLAGIVAQERAMSSSPLQTSPAPATSASPPLDREDGTPQESEKATVAKKKTKKEKGSKKTVVTVEGGGKATEGVKDKKPLKLKKAEKAAKAKQPQGEQEASGDGGGKDDKAAAVTKKQRKEKLKKSSKREDAGGDAAALWPAGGEVVYQQAEEAGEGQDSEALPPGKAVFAGPPGSRPRNKATGGGGGSGWGGEASEQGGTGSERGVSPWSNAWGTEAGGFSIIPQAIGSSPSVAATAVTSTSPATVDMNASEGYHLPLQGVNWFSTVSVAPHTTPLLMQSSASWHTGGVPGVGSFLTPVAGEDLQTWGVAAVGSAATAPGGSSGKPSDPGAGGVPGGSTGEPSSFLDMGLGRFNKAAANGMPPHGSSTAATGTTTATTANVDPVWGAFGVPPVGSHPPAEAPNLERVGSGDDGSPLASSLQGLLDDSGGGNNGTQLQGPQADGSSHLAAAPSSGAGTKEKAQGGSKGPGKKKVAAGGPGGGRGSGGGGGRGASRGEGPGGRGPYKGAGNRQQKTPSPQLSAEPAGEPHEDAAGSASGGKPQQQKRRRQQQQPGVRQEKSQDGSTTEEAGQQQQQQASSRPKSGGWGCGGGNGLSRGGGGGRRGSGRGRGAGRGGDNNSQGGSGGKGQGEAKGGGGGGGGGQQPEPGGQDQQEQRRASKPQQQQQSQSKRGGGGGKRGGRGGRGGRGEGAGRNSSSSGVAPNSHVSAPVVADTS